MAARCCRCRFHGSSHISESEIIDSHACAHQHRASQCACGMRAHAHYAQHPVQRAPLVVLFAVQLKLSSTHAELNTEQPQKAASQDVARNHVWGLWEASAAALTACSISSRLKNSYATKVTADAGAACMMQCDRHTWSTP